MSRFTWYNSGLCLLSQRASQWVPSYTLKSTLLYMEFQNILKEPKQRCFYWNIFSTGNFPDKNVILCSAYSGWTLDYLLISRKYIDSGRI